MITVVHSFAERGRAKALLHRVPYSLHNNFVKLRAFVGMLRPRAIRGIVRGGPSYKGCCIDPAVHFRDLLRPAAVLGSDQRPPPADVRSGSIRSWQVTPPHQCR